jgi:hypothetical protein
MTTQPCPTSAFIIAAAFYREASAAATRCQKDGTEYLTLGDQKGQGWAGVQQACRELGEWIEAHACEIVDFDSADECWLYFWDDTDEVAALFAAIDTSWPPASPAWVALLEAAIARHFPLL